MIEFALGRKTDVHDFFAQAPNIIQKRWMRVSIASELLIKAAQVCDSELDLPQDLTIVRRATLFYDIGFSLLPSRLLNKAEELTGAEYKVIQRHCHYGAKLLERYYTEASCTAQDKAFWKLAAETALSHHERWDGKGYPFGLRTTATPLISRAVALTDTYDAIVSGSMYRMALPHEYAVLEITDNSGTQFDPHLVHLFMTLRDDFHTIFSAELSAQRWQNYIV